jgi:replicative DNA helicase
MLSAEGKVNLKTLRRGMLSQSDWDRVTEAEARISEWPIWIDEEAGLTSGRISSKARRMHKEHGLEVLYIDHVHLVRGDRGVSSREREMALISGNLKGLAKELNIPVVALAQLNRKCEERTNKRPQLSDLRDSGALEQDADCVFGLYRDHHYNDNSDMNEAEFIINKQRNGEVGKIPLRWVPEWTTFMDAEVKRL